MSRQLRPRPVAMLGAGRAGGTLAVLLAARGWPVRTVWSQSARRARLVVRRVARASSTAPRATVRLERAVAGCHTLLLAVPDDAIRDVAQRLATQLPDTARVALHLSGSRGADELATLRRRGLAVGACHPLAVMPAGPPPPDLLDGAAFGLDGDATALFVGRRLARALGGVPMLIGSRQRAAWHLAASLVANDTVALFDAALAELHRAGIGGPAARHALAHLLRGTAEVLSRHDVEQAVTGPVVRGDAATLRRHLETAGRTTETGRLHRLLSAALLRIARRAGRITRGDARRVREVLREDVPS